ncbi:MAG TPA: hypothetical protein VGI83_10090 [Gemmatimonadales bacterium]|jgi:hypothetical protein
MRGTLTAVVALGLLLGASSARAQQSDVLPRGELREHLRGMRDDLRDAFSSRAFSARIRAEALSAARSARLEAQTAARAARQEALAMARMQRNEFRDRMRMHLPREPRMRVRHRLI